MSLVHKVFEESHFEVSFHSILPQRSASTPLTHSFLRALSHYQISSRIIRLAATIQTKLNKLDISHNIKGNELYGKNRRRLDHESVTRERDCLESTYTCHQLQTE